MPSFVDTFWSEDLQSGLDVLFKRLYHGCDQCDLFIQMFASRMQYEVAYGRQLVGIPGNVDGLADVIRDSKEVSNVSKNRFSDDQVISEEVSVSTVRALEGMLEQMSIEGNQHLTIASNIETLVLQPFSKWCTDHRERIKFSDKLLSKNVKNFNKSRAYVKKLENDYFSKCRALEEYKRTSFNDDELTRAMKSLKLQKKLQDDQEREKDNETFIKINSLEIDNKSMREILTLILTELPKSEYKLPLINFTVNNTNNGSEITKFLKESLSLKDLDDAETFGQELLNLGFLKYCNGVGNTFVNSKKFQYQWKPYAYKFARISYNEEESKLLPSSITQDIENNVSTYLQDMTTRISQRNVSSELELPNVTEEERTFFKLIKEMEDADKKYYNETFKMDSLRCSVEELVIDHLSFMEKCELDRLKAIKKATLDFCSTLGNKITSLKVCSEKLLEYEDSIDPVADLLSLLTNYHTGIFHPRAITYNNYYNPGAFQNFGIDLETCCRLDKKVVPLIISATLTYMDGMYPDMSNDKVRTLTWISPVKLSATHQLRALLNKRQFRDENDIIEVLKSHNSEPSTVASIIKLYLLELPLPLIPKDLSDVLSELYLEFPLTFNNDALESDELQRTKEENDKKRLAGLSNILSSLPKTHLATLDSITTHFYRLINILKMGENGEVTSTSFTDAISQEFATCIIQAHTSEDNDLGYRIFNDLLVHQNQIFPHLKKHGSKSG
ncbi:GTPase-activating protein RGD2 RNJ42_05179 [Nakaseomyces bracarensis]|uniref:GTPase-activating protein RGD2 n=1 Tax=Nakaseomyces bracarensis TaxID=273131 RepID=UPI0038717BE8